MELIKTYLKCCAKGISIGILSLFYLLIGLHYDLIDYHQNMVILLLWFTILLELSKTIIQMLVGDDAPIMIRYASASMVIVSFKEFYISFIAHDYNWMGISGAAIAFFLLVRYIAIHMTREAR